MIEDRETIAMLTKERDRIGKAGGRELVAGKGGRGEKWPRAAVFLPRDNV